MTIRPWGQEKVPATKSGQDPRYPKEGDPKKGGWYLFLHVSSVVSTGTSLYGGSSFSRTGGAWTSTIGDQRLTFSELTGRLTFASSGGGAVPEIDPATGSSAFSLVAGMLALLEQRRRRTSSRA